MRCYNPLCVTCPLCSEVTVRVDAFYNFDDPTLHNVDVMTDLSMAPTTFTRYTVAPSATSKASK